MSAQCRPPSASSHMYLAYGPTEARAGGLVENGPAAAHTRQLKEQKSQSRRDGNIVR
jgi:hypothetical protein